MMRKFTYYLLAFFTIFFVNGCNEEDVSSPPSSSFTVDKTTGLSGDTEFTFVVEQVNAKAIALLPLGQELSDGSVLISSFVDGKATIKYKYNKVGTFNAVVVTSNYSSDGEEIKRSYSTPISITVTSDKKEISAFTFPTSTKTVITQPAKTIVVTVPFGTDVTALKANFTASPFTSVSVGSTAQVSGTTLNSFASPVVYTVTAEDETSVSYTVTVIVTAAETDNTIKSFSATAISKSLASKAIGSYIDSNLKNVVLLIPDGANAEVKDSLKVSYTLNGAFAKLKLGGKVLKQDTLLNLTASKTLSAEAQDGTADDYDLIAAIAPKLSLTFAVLNPEVSGTNSDFNIGLNVLTGTTINSIVTTATITAGSGVTVTVMEADGNIFVSGGSVDYTEPVKFTLTVNDTNLGVVYEVVYTATVTVL